MNKTLQTFLIVMAAVLAADMIKDKFLSGVI